MKILVDTAVELPVNIMPLTDDSDFKTRQTSVAYNASGMDLVWNFVTPAGVITQTAVTPTTGGDYDWAHIGDGMYKIEVPASGGASINNTAEGYGYFTGIATGVLPWRSPTFEFVPANIANSLVLGTDVLDVSLVQILGSAITGTASQIAAAFTKWFNVATPTGTVNSLPDAVPDAAGGLPISDAGGLDLDAQLTTKINQIAADLPQRVTKNTALAKFPFKMVDSTDHITAETGLTVTATRSLDGAAFGACANSAAEIGSGWYYIDLDAADLNGNTVVLKFTATGADTREITIITQPT